jgi:hypothetical protein
MEGNAGAGVQNRRYRLVAPQVYAALVEIDSGLPLKIRFALKQAFQATAGLVR